MMNIARRLIELPTSRRTAREAPTISPAPSPSNTARGPPVPAVRRAARNPAMSPMISKIARPSPKTSPTIQRALNVSITPTRQR